MSTANDILMSGGGTFVSFKNHTDSASGTVINIGEPYQTREYNNATNKCDGPLRVTKAGKPVMAFHITLETAERDPSDSDDDGTRVVDVNSWRMRDAIRNAVRATNAPGLEIGGRLTVTYTHDEVPGDSRSGKHFSASYVRGANAALMGEPAQPAAQAAPPAAASAPPGLTPEQAAAFQAWTTSQQTTPAPF